MKADFLPRHPLHHRQKQKNLALLFALLLLAVVLFCITIIKLGK